MLIDQTHLPYYAGEDCDEYSKWDAIVLSTQQLDEVTFDRYLLDFLAKWAGLPWEMASEN